eukprot:GHVQ01032820.1.p1 GENE.GHVQ01032820.1~~GHVQ01032820.1.p1  ORF type:complete len:556 (+),score=78.51 GHVQ01032820.1:124-1791(+)
MHPEHRPTHNGLSLQENAAQSGCPQKGNARSPSHSPSVRDYVDWAVLKNTEANIPKYNGLAVGKWTPASEPGAVPHMNLPNTIADRSEVILDSVLDFVGNTPMIRLSRFAKHYNLKCDLVAKCEFFSAGGSVKDRIGKRMVEEAEMDGKIKPGDTLIEPTSGNTGVALALAAAVKGYKMVMTLPEKMSKEKVNVMKALGAEILRTPTEARWDSPDSHIGLAFKLQKLIPDSAILDQYQNPANPLAHYEWTAEEILKQCHNKVDMVVVAAGTGGTITGIGRKIKERLPNCVVVAVDPKGSSLAVPDSLNDELRDMPYKVEGIGYDFIPGTLDRSVVDEWVKTEDSESFRLARDLISMEGLLCGGSSGSAMAGVLKAARKLKEGQRCVVVLPDSSRNYMTKFMSDEWMVEYDFSQTEGGEHHEGVWKDWKVRDLDLKSPVTVNRTEKLSHVIGIMDNKGVDQVPVIDENSKVIGVVTGGNLASMLESRRVTMNDDVQQSMFKDFKWVTENTSLHVVSRILDDHPFVLVKKDGQDELDVAVAVVSRIDLLKALRISSH